MQPIGVAGGGGGGGGGGSVSQAEEHILTLCRRNPAHGLDTLQICSTVLWLCSVVLTAKRSSRISGFSGPNVRSAAADGRRCSVCVCLCDLMC